MNRMYPLYFLLFLLLLSCKKETIKPINKERESILLNGTQYKLWRDLRFARVFVPVERFLYFDDQGKMCKLTYDYFSKKLKLLPGEEGNWEARDDSTIIINGEKYISCHIVEDTALLTSESGKNTLQLMNCGLPEMIGKRVQPYLSNIRQVIQLREENSQKHRKLIQSSALLRGCEYKIWKYEKQHPFISYYLYFDDRGVYDELTFWGGFCFKSYYYDSICECTWYQFGTTVFLEGDPTFTVYPQRGDTLPIVYAGEKDTTYLFEQLGFYEPPKKSWQQKLGFNK